MAIGSEALEDLVAVIERRGHQARGLVGRVAEHDALVARAFVLVGTFIDAHRDFRRLAVEIVLEGELVPVEARLLVTDFLDGVADGSLDFLERAIGPLAVLVDALAADFTREDDEVGRGQRLARDARIGVLAEEQIDDRVADLVGDLVGMAFRDRLGGEEKIGTHAWDPHVEESFGRCHA